MKGKCTKMIRPGDKIGGRTVLRSMYLPLDRKPKFNSKTEMIWQFPKEPGLWVVCTLQIDLTELFVDNMDIQTIQELADFVVNVIRADPKMVETIIDWKKTAKDDTNEFTVATEVLKSHLEELCQFICTSCALGIPVRKMDGVWVHDDGTDYSCEANHIREIGLK